jgi:hypothetical protein
MKKSDSMNPPDATSSVPYKLLKVMTTDFNYSGPKKQFEHKPNMVNYEITPSVAMNPDLNQFIITISLMGKITSTDEKFFSAASTFVYEIGGLQSLIKVNEDDRTTVFGDQKIENQIISTLIGTSFSTMRGIIMEKGAGTILQIEFLPIINPMVFIKDPEAKTSFYKQNADSKKKSK